MTDKTEIELDEGYIHREGEQCWPARDYPFYDRGGERMIHCEPSKFFTALTDLSIFHSGEQKCAGIIAMATKDGGLFSHFTAVELREVAQRLEAMADYVESDHGNGS